MMQLVHIPREVAREAWILVRDWVVDAASRSNGRHTEETLLRDIGTGDHQLWIVWDTDKSEACAVGITQLIVYETGLKAADIIVLAGKGRKHWKHVLADFEAWASSEDCGMVQVFARRGWARELNDYKMSHVLLEKRL